MFFKAIALDFDGTLIESARIKDFGWEELYCDYPVPIRERIMAHHQRQPHQSRFEKFRFITENILAEPYTAELEQSLDRKYSEAVFDAVVKCPEVSGAGEFLDAFWGSAPLYLVTVNSPEYFQHICQARAFPLSRFAACYTNPPMNKAQALTAMLARERCRPSESVYVGDDSEDAGVASSLGIAFVGRDSGRFGPHPSYPVYRDLFGVKNALLAYD